MELCSVGLREKKVRVPAQSALKVYPCRREIRKANILLRN